VYESAAELLDLEDLLARSRASSTSHLREIIDDRRALSAPDVVSVLDGMKVVALATVTARGAPRISAVDGHFLHGAWTWSTSGSSAKAHDLDARPSVSVAHVDNEVLAVFSHGVAERLAPTGPRTTAARRSGGGRTSASSGWRPRGWSGTPLTARSSERGGVRRSRLRGGGTHGSPPRPSRTSAGRRPISVPERRPRTTLRRTPGREIIGATARCRSSSDRDWGVR